MERQRWHIILIIVVHVLVYFALNTALLLQSRGFENIEYNLNYMHAVKNFLNDPTTLYESPDERMRLRTLPFVVLYYAFFHVISPNPMGSYLVCITWMLIWNIGSALIIEKVTRLDYFQSIQTRSFLKDPRVLILLYLCSFWHSGEYYSAPPNVIAGFFAILGMYYIMQSKDHLAFFAWGVSMTFKLFPVFLVLFFLLKTKKKNIWKSLLYLTISMLPNLLMFMIWPSLLGSFISSNITTSLATTFSIFSSGSLARLFSVLSTLMGFPDTFLQATLIFFVVGMLVTALVFLKYGKNMNILDQAILAFTCGIVVFPDFYPGHTIILWGLLLLWLATRNDHVDGTIKLIYFIVTCYLTTSILNPLYAVPFAFILGSLLVMFSKPRQRNNERLKNLYHLTYKPLLLVYIFSIIDLAIILMYLGAFG
ncbi:MAG: hypothetical protein Q6373_012405 [Candidatus Sigynarchaeota archaeon]